MLKRLRSLCPVIILQRCLHLESVVTCINNIASDGVVRDPSISYVLWGNKVHPVRLHGNNQHRDQHNLHFVMPSATRVSRPPCHGVLQQRRAVKAL